MKRCLCAAVAVFCLIPAAAQDVIKAALYLSGASSEEELPQEYVELVENSPRIRVNANRIRPGLLSDYQIASLADYRAFHGDILSFEELALVDGFSADAVAALQPFLSLESSRKPGSTDTVRVHGTALVRGTLTSFGGKAKVSGDGWRAGGAWRGSGGSFYGENASRFGRVLAGDFNLRFGQGLASWTGFSMTSLSTVDAFVLRPTGLVPAWSYSASGNRGLAYEYASGHWRAAAFGTLSGLFGSHADWLWRKGQLGATVLVMPGTDRASLTISADGRYNHRGSDLAWEAAYKSGSFAGKAAFRLPLGDAFRLAFQGRVIPSRFSGKKNGEYGLAVGTSFKSGNSVPKHQASLTVDASLLPLPDVDPRRLQVRVYATWLWQLRESWAVELRLTERYRNYELPRTDFRTDVKWSYGPWLSVLRGEVVKCEKVGLLGYWEGGYKGLSAAGYFRVTGFRIQQWNDRIYCYERDAPGTFSVPAYSGLGVAISAVGSWKHRFRWFTLKIYGRGGYMFRHDKESSPTLNLQLQVDL